MAAKKTATGTAARSEQTEPMFSKEQILASARLQTEGTWWMPFLMKIKVTP